MSRKILLLALLLCNGCAVSNHGVFPKLVWYWSADAKEQRRENAEHEAAIKKYQDQQKHKTP